MNPDEPKDNLPEMFRKVLDYLSLEEVIKLRAVSRGFRDLIDSFRVKSLCCSLLPAGKIYPRSRWVSGEFAQNFIRSTRFASFFRTFGPSILCNLQHLGLLQIVVKNEDKVAFTETLNSFGQLKELDLFHMTWADRSDLAGSILQLNLPILHSFRIHMLMLGGLRKIVLDTPSLREVRLETGPDLQVELVHVESVEKVVAGNLANVSVKNMKNLKYLYSIETSIDSTFLAGLDQLKELHLYELKDVSTIFEQKQRYGRADLKVYLYGCLLSGPDSPLVSIPDRLKWPRYFAVAAGYPSELADELPFDNLFFYTIVERVAPELQDSFLSRFTILDQLCVTHTVQDVQRFLDLLKNSGHIAYLQVTSGDQPQDLFDRLPEHCPGLQNLTIYKGLADAQFALRLKNLNTLRLTCALDEEFIRKVPRELPVLSSFEFQYMNKSVKIEAAGLDRLWVSFDTTRTRVSDLNAAIQLVIENIRPSG